MQLYSCILVTDMPCAASSQNAVLVHAYNALTTSMFVEATVYLHLSALWYEWQTRSDGLLLQCLIILSLSSTLTHSAETCRVRDKATVYANE